MLYPYVTPLFGSVVCPNQCGIVRVVGSTVAPPPSVVDSAFLVQHGDNDRYVHLTRP